MFSLNVTGALSIEGDSISERRPLLQLHNDSMLIHNLQTGTETFDVWTIKLSSLVPFGHTRVSRPGAVQVRGGGLGVHRSAR